MKKRQIQLQVSFLKEGNRFVAYSPALDFSTSGKTLKEAQRMFDEGVNVFFDELEHMGTTEEVLMSMGWSKRGNSVEPPVVVSQSLQSISVAV